MLCRCIKRVPAGTHRHRTLSAVLVVCGHASRRPDTDGPVVALSVRVDRHRFRTSPKQGLIRIVLTTKAPGGWPADVMPVPCTLGALASPFAAKKYDEQTGCEEQLHSETALFSHRSEVYCQIGCAVSHLCIDKKNEYVCCSFGDGLDCHSGVFVELTFGSGRSEIQFQFGEQKGLRRYRLSILE